MAVAAAVSGTEELRRNNLRALLHAVHIGGPMTRAELTRLLGLNRSTIGGLTTTLIDLGLVAEQTAAQSAAAGAVAVVVLADGAQPSLPASALQSVISPVAVSSRTTPPSTGCNW